MRVARDEHDGLEALSWNAFANIPSSFTWYVE